MVVAPAPTVSIGGGAQWKNRHVRRARIVREAGGWSVFVPGPPVAADGASLDAAVTGMVDALREYAEDRRRRLRDRLVGAANRLPGPGAPAPPA
ncbi:hypothetical protein [Saccharothrix yanglingensis]|uniref:hypothetical protein n=1 Tax=Saccharothrix yanglingensis TaxID=659496 RepID=UPI0027D33C2F|nr:hypothetical protein [Saccharothrix yanglingensis]